MANGFQTKAIMGMAFYVKDINFPETGAPLWKPTLSTMRNKSLDANILESRQQQM